MAENGDQHHAVLYICLWTTAQKKMASSCICISVLPPSSQHQISNIINQATAQFLAINQLLIINKLVKKIH